jgi:hypothetical protein
MAKIAGPLLEAMFVVGVVATVVVMLIVFGYHDRSGVCLDPVGPNGQIIHRCPHVEPFRNDLLNALVTIVLYGGPALVAASILGWLLRTVMQRRAGADR